MKESYYTVWQPGGAQPNPNPETRSSRSETLNAKFEKMNRDKVQALCIRLAHWLLEHNPNTPHVLIIRLVH